mgnify:CR=1 FL=1
MLHRNRRRCLFRAVATNHLPGQRQVSHSAFGNPIVFQCRQTVTGGFGQPDVAGNHRTVDLVTEIFAELARYIQGQAVARVVHGTQYALNLKIRVHRFLNLLDGVHQGRQAFQRVILALHRNKHGIGGRQGVDRQQTQRRRAINQDVVVVFPNGVEGQP